MTKKITLLCVAALLSIQGGHCQWMRSIEPSSAKAKVMETLTKFTPADPLPSFGDVVYARRSDTDLHIRFIRPDNDANTLRPCIVFVQGAAWFKQDLDQKLTYLLEFSKRGYVIASVEHRPSTTAAYPAQIQDVKSAVRYIRDNADKYGVDICNLFIWGDSSGGNMALLETLTQDVPTLDTPEEYGRQSLEVNACVAFYPVTDVLRMQEFAPDYMDHIGKNSPTGTLFGHIPVMENPDIVKTVSPIEYVSREKAGQTAPILIVTGNRDNVVPYEQSVIMADKLEDCGYDYKFYKIEGGDHGSWEFWTPEVSGIVDDFFKAHLKPTTRRIADQGGSGPYKAIITGHEGIAGYTVYRPENLAEAVAAEGKLPVVLFGNGGCSNSSAGFAKFLTEIASRGYVVIAIGPFEQEEFHYTDLQGTVNDKIPVQRTEALGLLSALDWLSSQSGNPDSEYFNMVDTDRCCAMGQSCGGSQALVLGTCGDKRIKSVIALNSGVTSPGDFLSNVVTKNDLKKLKGSILYLIGGPSDIAYKNAVDDFSRIKRVPVVLANTDIGHGGTYGKAHGGSFGELAVEWLDYQFKGRKDNRLIFLGQSSLHPEWTFESKKF